MAENSKIEWTDATWNHIVGCSVVSPGCTNCYAMRLAGTRMASHPTREGLTTMTKAGPVWNGKVRFLADKLTEPLRWNRPRMIFVGAHTDLFHDEVPDEWIDKTFAVMGLAPQHTFQVLTKRTARMRRYLSDPKTVERIYDLVCDEAVNCSVNVVLIAQGVDERQAPAGPRVYLGAWPLRNVWIGASVEDQTRFVERIPDLLATPAAVRWLSAEPLLGRIEVSNATRRSDVASVLGKPALQGIDWVVVGGESGPGARPMHPGWARSLRDQCKAAGVAFLFKQWGEWAPAGRSDPTKKTVWPNGTVGRGNANDCGGGGCEMTKVGKKRAGRLLDGVTHDEYPEVRHG